jgi:hypothetical protein
MKIIQTALWTVKMSDKYHPYKSIVVRVAADNVKDAIDMAAIGRGGGVSVESVECTANEIFIPEKGCGKQDCYRS